LDEIIPAAAEEGLVSIRLDGIAIAAAQEGADGADRIQGLPLAVANVLQFNGAILASGEIAYYDRTHCNNVNFTVVDFNAGQFCANPYRRWGDIRTTAAAGIIGRHGSIPASSSAVTATTAARAFPLAAAAATVAAVAAAAVVAAAAGAAGYKTRSTAAIQAAVAVAQKPAAAAASDTAAAAAAAALDVRADTASAAHQQSECRQP
jgi:hypothetical protein